VKRYLAERGVAVRPTYKEYEEAPEERRSAGVIN
jgi:hypothetical protein